MHLSKREVAALRRYQQYRHASPTFTGMLRSGRLWPWAVFAIVIVLSLLAVASDVSVWYGWFMLGYISGIIYMLLSRLWCSLGSWPLMREIIDWKRVEELIQESENRIG